MSSGIVYANGNSSNTPTLSEWLQRSLRLPQSSARRRAAAFLERIARDMVFRLPSFLSWAAIYSEAWNFLFSWSRVPPKTFSPHLVIPFRTLPVFNL